MEKKVERSIFGLLLMFMVSGCATYTPPGGKANLEHFGPSDIRVGFEVKPSNPFPASIAVVRVQSPTYRNFNLNHNGGRFGSGRYSVILAKELNEDKFLDKITELDQIGGLVSINRMLLPERLEGDKEIRVAASRLKADLVFLYTLDTTFFETDASKPLSVITLGLSPTNKISAHTTCSALLLDTRTGYIYAAYETTESSKTISSSWGSQDTADQSRRNNEEKAFEKLVEEFIVTWPRVLVRHSNKSPLE